MTIDEMIKRKRELGLTFDMIASISGLSVATIKKIFRGEVKNPRYSTLQRLEHAFYQGSACRMREAGFEYATASVDKEYGMMTLDELVHHPRNGSYTCDDYELFDEDIRAEIIDGWIYALAAPSSVHQLIVGELDYQIKAFMRRKNRSGRSSGCISMVSPVDVKLGFDNKTMVQPDLLILCDKDKLKRKRIEGTPDFIVEVVSESTKSKDRVEKLDKYRETGVREYWLVDYEAGAVTVILFASGRGLSEEMSSGQKVISMDKHARDYYDHYTIRDQIPVGLFDGELVIDFAEIDDYIKSIVG